LSPDHLPNFTSLGICDAFRVKTFNSRLIENQRKSLIYFEGCNKELGSSVVLRGGTLSLLKQLKEVFKFLVFVGYNLRLESFLRSDQNCAITSEWDPIWKKGFEIFSIDSAQSKIKHPFFIRLTKAIQQFTSSILSSSLYV
jgi:hypothetical protein